MPNFIIVDHSVDTVGGHHFEYSLHILHAAEAAGYRPIFAVNQRFSEQSRLPGNWRVLPIYRHDAYEISYFREKQKRVDPDGLLHDRKSLWRRIINLMKVKKRIKWAKYQRRQTLIHERFIEDTAAVFAQLQLSPGDQIFLPTLCIDDLESFVKFLKSEPRAATVDWHVQFHFKIYEGRPAGYDAQEPRLTAIRQLFQQLVEVLPADKVHFYTTTEHLARQYNRLGSIKVQALPYPVNPDLLRKQKPYRATRQLRVTFPGGSRPEKGLQHVRRAIGSLWHDYVEGGRLRLVIQAKDLDALPPELQPHAKFDEPANQVAAAPSNVAVVRWPLSPEGYLDLIVRSHIGLLLYDADQYYVRCSGVMVEMLKAGVPVIVPAGCWMADQLAEPIFRHRDRLCESLTSVAVLTADAARWESPAFAAHDRIAADTVLQAPGREESLCSQVRIPARATHLCVRFRWPEYALDGTYLELVMTQTSDGRHQLENSKEIVGVRAGGEPVPVLIPLVAGARQVQIVWRNAHGEGTLDFAQVEFHFLQAAPGESLPLGAVGLIAADLDQVPHVLRDMADHYEHYRRTAREFAPAWGNWHSPETVVEQLIAAVAPLRNLPNAAAPLTNDVLRFDLPMSGAVLKIKGSYVPARVEKHSA